MSQLCRNFGNVGHPTPPHQNFFIAAEVVESPVQIASNPRAAILCAR
jgi:hypothetical protein